MLFDESVLRTSSVWNRRKTLKFSRCEILQFAPTSRISIEPSQSIYHFEDLQTRNRMQKTGARNIDFEARYDHLNFWLKIKSSKTVFGLYRSNQSPERNGSSVKNECLDNIYRSHIVGLHLEGTIFFGPWPLPDLLRGRRKSFAYLHSSCSFTFLLAGAAHSRHVVSSRAVASPLLFSPTRPPPSSSIPGKRSLSSFPDTRLPLPQGRTTWARGLSGYRQSRMVEGSVGMLVG